jgi:hypothetical protein
MMSLNSEQMSTPVANTDDRLTISVRPPERFRDPRPRHAFPVSHQSADPFVWFPEYHIDLDDADLARLGSNDPQHLLVLAIVTMPAGAGDPCTANLHAPLLINVREHTAHQSIRPDDGCGLRAVLSGAAESDVVGALFRATALPASPAMPEWMASAKRKIKRRFESSAPGRSSATCTVHGRRPAQPTSPLSASRP